MSDALQRRHLHIAAVNELNNLALVALQISQEQCLILYVAVIQRLFISVWTLYRSNLYKTVETVENFVDLSRPLHTCSLVHAHTHTPPPCSMSMLHSELKHVRSTRDLRAIQFAQNSIKNTLRTRISVIHFHYNVNL